MSGSVSPPVSPRQARTTLLIFAGFTALCLLTAFARDPTPPFIPPPGATTDLDVFGRIVARIHAGENFYDASQAELRAHGYPTRSVFNWRTPIYALWLASGPGWLLGKWLVVLGSFTAVGLTCKDLLDEYGPCAAGAGGVFVVGSLSFCLGGPTYLFTELWAGIFLALSVCAYHRRVPALGVVLGLAAVFYRELALPYALVCLGLAVRKKRTRESLAWLVGLSLFVVMMALHARQVHARLTPLDVAIEGGWVRFGGVRFLLRTSQVNVFLLGFPLSWTAFYLPLALLGLYGSKGEDGLRVGLSMAAFLVAFAAVGHPYNYYWGLVDAPLLATGVAGAPRALRELLHSATIDEPRGLSIAGPRQRPV
jgi:hypothetical protein